MNQKCHLNIKVSCIVHPPGASAKEKIRSINGSVYAMRKLLKWLFFGIIQSNIKGDTTPVIVLKIEFYILVFILFQNKIYH